MYLAGTDYCMTTYLHHCNYISPNGYSNKQANIRYTLSKKNTKLWRRAATHLVAWIYYPLRYIYCCKLPTGANICTHIHISSFSSVELHDKEDTYPMGRQITQYRKNASAFSEIQIYRLHIKIYVSTDVCTVSHVAAQRPDVKNYILYLMLNTVLSSGIFRQQTP